MVHAYRRRDHAQQIGQLIKRVQAIVPVRIDHALVARQPIHRFLVAGRRRHNVQRGADRIQRLAVLHHPLAAQTVGQGNAKRIVGHGRAASRIQVAEP